MSALGLTCREAFTVFSQNETLRLQQEVLRLEKEFANLKARIIRKNLSDGYAPEGCFYGMCAFCECETNDCFCDWMCECNECRDDRDFYKDKAWTNDEIRTIRRRPVPAGCIQICDVCDAGYDEECLCDWTCECDVCETSRGILENEGWTEQQLKAYNRTHRLKEKKTNVPD